MREQPRAVGLNFTDVVGKWVTASGDGGLNEASVVLERKNLCRAGFFLSQSAFPYLIRLGPRV